MVSHQAPHTDMPEQNWAKTVDSGTPQGQDWASNYLQSAYKTQHVFAALAAREAERRIHSDLQQGVIGDESGQTSYFRTDAIKHLQSLEQQVAQASNPREKGWYQAVLKETERFLNHENDLDKLGFAKGEQILGTDGNGAIRTSASKGEVTTRNEFNSVTGLSIDHPSEPGTAHTDGFVPQDASKPWNQNKSHFDMTTTYDAQHQPTAVDIKYDGGNRPTLQINGQNFSDVQTVHRELDKNTGRYDNVVTMGVGDHTQTVRYSSSDINGVHDVIFENNPVQPDYSKTTSALNPVGDQIRTLDVKPTGVGSIARGDLDDSSMHVTDRTQMLMTDTTNPDGSLNSRSIHFDYQRFVGNSGKTELNVDGPGGQRKLSNVTDIQYRQNGAGFDVSYVQADGSVVKAKTSVDGKAIIAWDQ